MSVAQVFLLSILVELGHGIQVRGNVEWTMFLCKYADEAFEPRPPVWFENWMTEETLDGSVINYFKRVSNGLYTTYNSRVYGWYSLAFSKDEVKRQASADRSLDEYKELDRKMYFKTKELCVDQGIRTYNLQIKPGPNIITIINGEITALFCKQGGVLMGPSFTLTAALTHEMVHSFHVGHSYSDQPVKIFAYAAPGEYDDQYDLMSTAHAYMYTSSMGFNGPGLSGPHLDYLGWLPANRIYYFGKDGPIQRLNLASLSIPHKETKDWLMIILPYDRNDPLKYFTVELRSRHNLDYGLPRAGVLVHKMVEENGFYYAKLINQGGPFYDLVQNSQWTVFIDRSRFIRLSVERLDDAGSATLLIQSTFTATACLSTETQRLAFGGDIACVTDRQRQNVVDAVLQQTSRKGANGECVSSYIKRQAFAEDDLCITARENEEFLAQNARWKKIQSFFHAETFGLNACLDEMVWRQVDNYDYVCVTKLRRDEVVKQNSMDSQRKAADGRCFQGFVYRAAITNDNDTVCVSETERSVANTENLRNGERLLYHKFFNGEDEL